MCTLKDCSDVKLKFYFSVISNFKLANPFTRKKKLKNYATLHYSSIFSNPSMSTENK